MKTIKRGPWILLLFLVLSGMDPLYSQMLDDYLGIAAENNPGLRAEFNTYLASLERVPQSGALPDPQLSFGLFVKPMERFMGNQVAEISVMQMFPWFGTLDAAKNEASLMARAKYEGFKEEKTALFYEVKATWYALSLLESEIAITEENVRILQMLEEIAIHRFESGGTGGGMRPSDQMGKSFGSSGSSGDMGGMGRQGQTTAGNRAGSGSMSTANDMGGGNGGGRMVDVLRVQMEAQELKNKLALLEDSRQPLVAMFNRLLNRPFDESITLPDRLTAAALPVFVTDIPDSIRQNNPMLTMLEKEEEALLARKEMNRKMGFPMIGLGLQCSVFQQRPGSEMDGRNMWMPMATISIPLWRKKYSAAVKEAGLLRESTRERRRDASNALLVRYEETMKQFKDAERRRELYKRQTEIAQQAQGILTVQYATAGSEIEEVLRMQQRLLDYRLRGLEAVVDQNVAVAMLEKLMGR